MTHPGWVTLISNYPLEIAKSRKFRELGESFRTSEESAEYAQDRCYN
jgi:hypothetical protein